MKDKEGQEAIEEMYYLHAQDNLDLYQRFESVMDFLTIFNKKARDLKEKYKKSNDRVKYRYVNDILSKDFDNLVKEYFQNEKIIIDICNKSLTRCHRNAVEYCIDNNKIQKCAFCEKKIEDAIKQKVVFPIRVERIQYNLRHLEKYLYLIENRNKIIKETVDEIIEYLYISPMYNF